MIEDTEEESSDSSGSHRSKFDEDPEEVMQKILVELKISKKKPDVEDNEYVPTPLATLESTHSSKDVPLKCKVEELRKKRRKAKVG